MTDIIFHHYERSPFSEKVRLVFGLKGITWRSVIIPAWMPKPELTPLTGGYRKTPVMQIGADIYCDTRIILREIDRRFPKFALHAAGGGDLIAAWADTTLFTNTVGIVFATSGDRFPKELREDREKFSGGRFSADRFKAYLPALSAQFDAQLRWIEEALADGRGYLLGGSPSIADFAVYHPLWFVRLNVRQPDFVAAYSSVTAWLERMRAHGHGVAMPFEAKEALAIAKAASPAAVEAEPYDDPSGCRVGDQVTVAANDYGRDPVAGKLLAVNDCEIVIRRHDPLAGDLNIHFPRVGFDLTAVPA
jgi:glutathione S-transferase